MGNKRKIREEHQKKTMLKVISMVQYIFYNYNNINMLYSQIIQKDKTW